MFPVKVEIEKIPKLLNSQIINMNIPYSLFTGASIIRLKKT